MAQHRAADANSLVGRVNAEIEKVLSEGDATQNMLIRAVLKAIRRATPEQVKAGFHERNINGAGDRGIPRIWTAMVDALLKDVEA